jgi:hypothetical protein
VIGAGKLRFVGGECGQRLQELGVAGVLAVGGLGQGLFRGGEFGSIVGLRRYLHVIYRRYLRRTETLRGSGSTSDK